MKEDVYRGYASLLKRIADIKQATESSFSVYIEKSVKDFLEEQKKIEDFVKSITKDISTQIASINDLISNNLLGIILGTVTALITLSTRPDIKSLLPLILFFFFVLLTLVTIYSAYTIHRSAKITIQDYRSKLRLFLMKFIKDYVRRAVGSSFRKQDKLFESSFILAIFVNGIICILILDSLLHSWQVIKGHPKMDAL